MNDTRKPDRVLLIGAVVVGVIVLVAALVGLTRSEPATLDPNTPEGTAQRYVQAVLDRDDIAAQQLLANDNCSVGSHYFGNETVRARLVDSSVSGDTATVIIELIYSGGNPMFGGYGYDDRTQIRLQMTPDGWRVGPDSWPYFPCEVNE